jgi:hypothetical protein
MFIDACAIIAVLSDEPEASRVSDAIASGKNAFRFGICRPHPRPPGWLCRRHTSIALAAMASISAIACITHAQNISLCLSWRLPTSSGKPISPRFRDELPAVPGREAFPHCKIRPMEPRPYGRLYRLPIRFEREPDVQLLAVSPNRTPWTQRGFDARFNLARSVGRFSRQTSRASQCRSGAGNRCPVLAVGI